MINHLIDKLTPNYNKLKHSVVFGILFCLSFLLRFPFFFRDYIDRDESTFILMAQSWVEGNLPYTELWDLKPPFAFLFFAIIIYLFGKSFIAIRLAGTLIVAITAFYSYRIGESLSSKKVALWISISCVALQSMFGSIQGVMSEHIGMVFLMPAIYIIISKKEWFWLGLAGILMGISSMVKLNMAYSILFIGLFLIYFFIREKKLKSGFFGIVAYGLGIIGVVALSWLPYYLENLQDVWWKSVIIAPIDYAQASNSNLLKLMPTLIIISTFFYFLWKKKYLDFKNVKVQILLVAILGVLYSFFKVGRVNTHYLIQLYPLLIVFVGVFISKFYTSLKFTIPKGFILLMLLIPAESYLEYFRIIKHKIERGNFFNGEGITVLKNLQLRLRLTLVILENLKCLLLLTIREKLL